MDLISLISYTSKNHHAYFDDALAELSPLAAKVAEVHATEHPEVVKVNHLFSTVVSELSEQISLEENIVFPFIKNFMEQEKSFTENHETIIDTLNQTIKNIEVSFTISAEAFKAIGKVSSNYTLPEGACNSYSFLYKKLNEFEHELHKYIHFEKNILFPKLLKLM